MVESRLRLLGGFTCESSGTVIELPASVQRPVAFLALHGNTHRCHVAGTLWPDVPESQAHASLRTAMWRAHKLAPGLIATTGPGLAISARTSVDTDELESLAMRLLRGPGDEVAPTDGGLDTLQTGQLLPGWYDDWVVFERERLDQLRLHALETCARLLIRSGELGAALGLALEAVRGERLRESANATLIAVYLAEGNASDAFRQYDDYRRLLSTELGLVPSPRLAEMLPERVDAVSRS